MFNCLSCIPMWALIALNTWVSFVITVVILLFLNKSIIFEHEMGHAKKALEYGYKVLIMLPYKRKIRATYGVDIFFVSRNDFRNIVKSKNVSGVAIYDCNDFSESHCKLITSGGPKAELRWLFEIKQQVRMLVPLILKDVAIYCLLRSYSFSFLVISFVCSVAVEIAMSLLRYRSSMGIFPMRDLKKFRKKLEMLPSGSTYTGDVCDGAKMKHRARYLECLEIIKSKHLADENNYHFLLRKLEAKGYTSVNEDDNGVVI